jgi:hypothetical protein
MTISTSPAGLLGSGENVPGDVKSVILSFLVGSNVIPTKAPFLPSAGPAPIDIPNVSDIL